MEDGVGIQRTNPEKTSTFHGKIGEIYSDRGGFAGEHEDRLEIDIISRSSDGKTQIKTTQSYRCTAFSIEQNTLVSGKSQTLISHQRKPII
jgi:hypothetical protein